MDQVPSPCDPRLLENDCLNFSCCTGSLRQVYGVNTDAGGINANTESLFRRYGATVTPPDAVCACDDAVTYFVVGYTPYIHDPSVSYSAQVSQ